MDGELNVLGTPLVPCGYDPLTGWARDGCCRSHGNDAGSHVVCAKVTVEFLNFQMEQGNDLITPRPALRFRGLKPGDRWCVCALRWRAAGGAGGHPRQGAGIRAARLAAQARGDADAAGLESARFLDGWVSSSTRTPAAKRRLRQRVMSAQRS